MELECIEYKNVFVRFINKIRSIWAKIWESKLYTFIFLACILTGVLVFTMSYPAFFNSLLNDASDDILQYYPYVGGFFEKIQTNTLSLYDKNLMFGASFFSGLYYIPLDIFTFIAFLFSYIIPGEMAYAGTFVLRIMAGSFIFYYVLVRHLNNKTAFFGAIILFIGGMVEAYYIFPIYLGIVTYAPLAMLIVDLCIEKKGVYYYLVPIYVASVVFFDFYMAYMLIGFLCIYYVIKNHIENEYSIFGKNTIFINKKFWLRFLEFMGMVAIGLLISMFILLPSALYILNESSRQSTNITESIWYFSKKVDGENAVSWRHYFTQVINLFIPNEPHRFCLVEAGDYVREHASLYVTSGGLIYLCSFFLIFRQRENRLKFWVVLFNILLLIPLFSMILGLNTSPYVRWFFIPYMLNIYAMALGMNNMEMKLGKYNLFKILPLAVLSVGISLITYVLIAKPDLYIHYHVDDPFFYPILIGALIFTGSYFILLLCWMIFNFLKKNPKVFIILMECFIFLEVIFGGIVIFINVGNSNSYYIDTKTMLKTQKTELEKLGYKESDGYRINAYSSNGWSTLNANTLMGVNAGRYFQSFYPVGANKLYSAIYMDYSTDWGRVFNFGYSLIGGPLYNTKYIATNENLEMPEKYYDKYTDDNYTYYIFKEDIPFIVYDKGYTSPTSLGALERQASLLEYAYIYKPEQDKDYYKEQKLNYELSMFESYGAITDSNFEIVSYSNVSSYVSQFMKKLYLDECNIEYNEYRVYDLTTTGVKNVLNNMDAVYVWPSSSNFRKEDHSYMYLREKNTNNPEEVDTEENYGSLHQMHYNDLMLGEYTPTQLLVQFKKEEYSKGLDLYAYSYKLIDNFINHQSEYTDKYFSLDGDIMKIKCTMPNSKARIIKTAYAYSEDWKIKNNTNYETVVVDGAFLGILVPEGETNVDITLRFEPAGYYLGLQISLSGIILFLTISLTSLGVLIIRRKKWIN